MEQLKNKAAEMLEILKKECDNKEHLYKADNREDEALFEKIKRNIAQIFLSMLGVSYKQTKSAGGNEEMLISKFSKFFDTIPATWKASLEDAKETDDYETVYVEETKIAMADRIKVEFLQIASSIGGKER